LLEKNGLATAAELEQISVQARQVIEDSVKFAEAAPDPDPDSIMDGVYA
jgi:pyruvate dehydrogenase E1 component alpha subunit